MSTRNTHDFGDLVKVYTEEPFTDALTGVPLDPDSVNVTVKDPAGTITNYVYGTDLELVNDGVGDYHMHLDANLAGVWHYRFWSTGNGQAAEGRSFEVRKAVAVEGVTENDPSRTWIMRRMGPRVGSNKVIAKASGEAPLMWADVSRLLTNETIGDATDIDVTAEGMTAGGIDKSGELISFTLTGGDVSDDGEPVDVVIEFEDSAGQLVECRGLVLVV